MTKSIYEQLNANGTIAKQRFVENFSGDALDTDRWTTYGTAGNYTISMDDAVNGGLYLVAGTNDNDAAGIGFGGSWGGDQTVRHFSNTASKIIFVQKFSASGEYQASESGFDQHLRNDGLGGAKSGAVLVTSTHNTNSKWVLRTANGSGYSGVTYITSSSMDTDRHVFTIECKASSVELTIDGVTESTSTTTLPIERMGVSFGIQTEGTGTGKTNINYVEAYNT